MIEILGGFPPAAAIFLLDDPFGIGTSDGFGARVKPDGTFSVMIPRGDHRITLEGPAGYRAISISKGNTDLMKEPLRTRGFPAGARVSEIRIVVGRDPAIINP